MKILLKRATLGKGKRMRKQVNYATEAVQQDWQQGGTPAGVNYYKIIFKLIVIILKQDQDYSDSYSGGSDQDGSGSGEDEHFDSAREERRRRREKDSEKLSPLLARVNGLLEVEINHFIY